MREFGIQKGGATGAAPIRVLVVDDSHVSRGLLTRSLDSDADIKVVGTASNGKVAIDEVKRQEIDVVVLDIEMPVMDGMTALPQIDGIGGGTCAIETVVSLVFKLIARTDKVVPSGVLIEPCL